MLDWVPPTDFDGLHLLRFLDSGGMGKVWVADDTQLKRNVAVKFIADSDPDRRQRERFLTEARAAAALVHPNVVAVHRIGEVQGHPYLVSEFVPGHALKDVERPMRRDLLLRVASGIARGLAAAHARGILHRDVKPSNAMLTETGEVKLLDFGLAKFVDGGPATASDDATPRSGLTQSGRILGTEFYIAPEVRRREPATPRGDVYSIGAVLYDLYTAAKPSYDRPTRELIASDRSLGRIIDRCLREDPSERFASASDLLAALEPPRGEVNPYRGLRPFEEEHRALFFGRDSEIREALERLRIERFVLVTGDSGTGKSSLCRAGIVPRVRDGELIPHGRASVIQMLPGQHPIRALAEALAPLKGETAESLATWLRKTPEALPRELPPIAGVNVVFLFVDQFEELITLRAAERFDQGVPRPGSRDQAHLSAGTAPEQGARRAKGRLRRRSCPGRTREGVLDQPSLLYGLRVETHGLLYGRRQDGRTTTAGLG